MSSNDKTRNKLMESMRMTKADPGKKPEAAETNASTKPAAATTAKKPAEKKKVAAKPAKAANKSTPNAADPFQSAQRVWPD